MLRKMYVSVRFFLTYARYLLDLVLEHELCVVTRVRDAGVEQGGPDKVPVDAGTVVDNDERGFVGTHSITRDVDPQAEHNVEQGLERGIFAFKRALLPVHFLNFPLPNPENCLPCF